MSEETQPPFSAIPRPSLERAPRIVLDVPIEAFAAIVLRRLGDGYSPPRTPDLVGGWVDDFRRTFDGCISSPAETGGECEGGTKPIASVFRANPMVGPGNSFQAVPHGEGSYPLFAIWRDQNQWAQFTNGTDRNRVTVGFCWALPANNETQRMWPLLTQFDFLLRRVLKNIYWDVETKALLNAALVRDYVNPWQTYRSKPGHSGAQGQAIYLTLTGEFQFDTYWERTPQNHGYTYQGFNAAYFTYLLRGRGESGSIQDSRLHPELASAAFPISQAEGVECPPPPSTR